MSLYHWEEVKMKCIIIINDIYLMVCTTTQVQHHTSGMYRRALANVQDIAICIDLYIAAFHQLLRGEFLEYTPTCS